MPAQLEIDKFLDRPCDLLSREVLGSLGYAAEGKSVENAGEFGPELAELAGPGCGWFGADDLDSRVLNVSLSRLESTKSVESLMWLQELHSQGAIELFEKTTVSGYPAAYWGFKDSRAKGDCSLMVAVSDTSLFNVDADLYLDEPEESCVDAESIAVELIDKFGGTV